MSTKSDATLGQIFAEAMRIWDAQKAEGVPVSERIAGLTKTLKASWPFTRTWRFYCDRCEDRGLVMAWCAGDNSCGRLKPHLAHDCGTPCLCEAGNRFREKPKHLDDAVTAAARVSKPTRLGR